MGRDRVKSAMDFSNRSEAENILAAEKEWKKEIKEITR